MTRAIRVFLVLLSVLLVPSLTEAGITVWRDKNHQGPSQEVDRAVPDLRRIGFDDQISSLTTDEPWLVCSEPRYRGECRLIDGSIENLHGSGMNDRISSLRPAPQGRARGWGKKYGGGEEWTESPRGARRSRGDERAQAGPRPVIRVYVHEDYRGHSETFDRAVPDLGDLGLARQITSVHVDRGEWEVCDRANYGGRCTVLRGSDDDLGSWSDIIASLRPVGSDRWRGGGGDDDRWDSGTRIRVYSDRDFEGRSETFEHDVPDLRRYGLAGQVASVRIEGGPWEICSEAGFRGECKVIRDSDAFLGWWAENIVSLRPARDQDR